MIASSKSRQQFSYDHSYTTVFSQEMHEKCNAWLWLLDSSTEIAYSYEQQPLPCKAKGFWLDFTLG